MDMQEITDKDEYDRNAYRAFSTIAMELIERLENG